MDSAQLNQEVELYLWGEEKEGLLDWYNRIIQSPQAYIVFATQRSYLLSLIFEKITGKQMEGKYKYFTDSAFMMQCDYLADYYKKTHNFPSILLCDDILIYGKHLNHFIENLKKCLLDRLAECDTDEVRWELVKALKIFVYARAEHPTLILGEYELNINYIKKEESALIKRLTNSISMLIRRSGMANTPYIYSDWVTDEEAQKFNLKDWRHTTYQGEEQYAWIRYLGKSNHIKAIYTIRLISNRFGGYRVIPFVFIPNLDTDETDNLMYHITNKLLQKGVFTGKDIQLISKWQQQEGKRSFNEFLTLVLSTAVLNYCKTELNIHISEEEQNQEIYKLTRNYMQQDWESTEDLIQKVVSSNLFTLNELDGILLDAVSDKRQMCFLYDDTEEFTFEKQMHIIDILENYFYNTQFQEEKISHQLSIKPYSSNNFRSLRKARGCCFILNEITGFHNQIYMEYTIAYFLQMMDAGIFELSPYPPSNTNVVGYAQYVKPLEQSLTLEILKRYEFIPLLCDMQEQCWRIGIDLLEGFKNYTNSNECTLPSGKATELLQFLLSLKELGQKPLDWKAGYMTGIDNQYHIQRYGINGVSEYMKRQRNHVENYRKYLKKEVYS